MTLARDFDRYWIGVSDDFPQYIDFALSNTCNLQCVMCNGDLSSSIRAQREGRPPLKSPYDDRFFAELAEFLPHLVDASFKGGEPFLSISSRRVWDMLLESGHRPRITVTTNGTQWNELIEHYVRELQMHVTLSVDGTTRDTVETIRSGAEFDRLQLNIDRFSDATSQSGGSLTLSFCLMPQNYREFAPFLAEAEQRAVQVQAIPVVAPHEFDILQLPTHQLSAVVEALEEASQELAPKLTINAHVWSEQLARISEALAHRATSSTLLASTDVVIRSAEPNLEDLRNALRRTPSAAILELELVNERVTSTRSTPWADRLFRPADWIGVKANEVPALMAAATGHGFPEIRTQERLECALHVTLDLQGTTPLRVRATAVLDASTRRIQRLLIAEPETWPAAT